MRYLAVAAIVGLGIMYGYTMSPVFYFIYFLAALHAVGVLFSGG